MNFHFSCQDKTSLRKCEPSFSANSLSNLVLAVEYTLAHSDVIFFLCKKPFLLPINSTHAVDVVRQWSSSRLWLSLLLQFQHQSLCKPVISYLPFPSHDLCLCLTRGLAMVCYRGVAELVLCLLQLDSPHGKEGKKDVAHNK